MVNIFGLIEEIQKLKLKVTGKLFLISIKTQKYRRELTPNITFQPNKIFVRNDLFEKIIKSCKATNLEPLKIKEKLGLCLYEDICGEKEFILMSKKIITQQLKEENKKLSVNENENKKVRMRMRMKIKMKNLRKTKQLKMLRLKN